MIKLYNYNKHTLKFKRVIERETLENKKIEFCTKTAIPSYDREYQYLKYDKETDNWIIIDIQPIEIVVDENQLIETKIRNKIRQIAIIELKKTGEIPEEY